MSFTRSIHQLDALSPGGPALAAWSAAIAGAAALLYPVPVIMAWLVLDDYMAMGSSMPFPMVPCLAAVGAVALGGALRAFSSYCSHKASFGIGRGLRLELMAHLGRLPLHWFGSRTTGGLKKIFSEDIGEVENFIAHNITDFMFALILPLLSIGLLLFVDWRLGLVLAALLALALLVQAGSLKQMKTSNFMDRYYAAMTMLHADAVEFVHGMPEIKIFNRSADSFGRMQQAIENMRAMQEEVKSFYVLQWARFLAVVNMPLTLLGCAGAVLFLYGGLPLQDLALFLTLGGIALLPMNRLMRFVAFIMRTMQGWASVQAVLAEPVERRGMCRREDIDRADLRIDGLRVAYDGEEVLHGISFAAREGTVTAIVGPSGSGKSTLAAVLAGLEKAAEGSITLGGIPLGDFSDEELARTFSIVFQQPFIFSGTVRENICLGNEAATREEMEEAVRLASCEDLIAGLPKGYETRIGHGGDVHLSGGQRQRIALARMALRDTPVVLLDEATAFADPESEEAIQAGLSGFLSGKTVLVIAHRLPSIAGADSIIVLDQGRIAEQGAHEDLLKANGLYARLWEAHNTARSWAIRGGREQNEVIPAGPEQNGEIAAC